MIKIDQGSAMANSRQRLMLAQQSPHSCSLWLACGSSIKLLVLSLDMLSAAAVTADEAVSLEPTGQSLQRQASADSLWGDLGAGLNLEGLDDWEEPQYVDVEGLVAQLVQLSAQDDPSTYLPVLQQLASPETPPYAIIGSEQWPQLAQLLPRLLASTHQHTAALAVQLLQQQLAPELLHCSPEPLAQLLTALLLAALRRLRTPGTTAAVQEDPQQQTGTGSAGNSPSVPSVQHGAHAGRVHQPHSQHAADRVAAVPAAVPAEAGVKAEGFAEYLQYPAAVLQFMTNGLQKLGRQWHFLDEPLVVALCAALASVLMEPLLLALSNHATSAAALSAGASVSGSAASRQQQEEQCQQQQHLQPLAVQLLLYDPMLSWFHRLNANAASSRPSKAAAAQQDLPQQLLWWAEQWVLHTGHPGSSGRGTGQASVTASAAGDGRAGVATGSGDAAYAAAQQQGCTPGRPQERRLHQQQSTAGSSSSTRCSASTGRRDVSGRAVVLCDCVAAHCLAAMFGTPSGRRLLQGLSTSGQQQPLETALVCLQGWADLQEQSPAQQQPNQQKQGTEHGKGSEQASSNCPFPSWGPIRPASLGPVPSRRTGTPECGILSLHEDANTDNLLPTESDHQAGQSEAGPDGAIGVGVDVGMGQALCVGTVMLSGVPVEVVVEAAAATAAWALKAYEEQKPWFPL